MIYLFFASRLYFSPLCGKINHICFGCGRGPERAVRLRFSFVHSFVPVGIAISKNFWVQSKLSAVRRKTKQVPFGGTRSVMTRALRILNWSRGMNSMEVLEEVYAQTVEILLQLELKVSSRMGSV